MASSAKVTLLRPPPVYDEDDDDDRPACPPVGAPAWLATFADIATNLMAFFVLILGFAKFDEVSFKKMAGSMRETFGTEMVAPIMDNAEGGMVLEMDFKPQGLPPDTVEGEEPPTGDEGREPNRDGEEAGRSPEEAAQIAAAQAAGEAAAQAMMQALASGKLTVEQGDKSVTVKLAEGEGQPTAEEVAEVLAALTGGAADAAGDEPGSDPDKQVAAPDQPAEEGTGEPAPGSGGAGGPSAGRATSPGFAEAKLSVALRDQSAQGLVEVERRDGKVFVTVGAGGAFESGSADLTEQAKTIMDEISANALAPDATITVTGHTDNVPLSGGPYTDNFGLGAARATSVVRELVESGKIDPSQIVAVSRGESAPVADNTTDAGREKNRRIEIEIDYGKAEGGPNSASGD